MASKPTSSKGTSSWSTSRSKHFKGVIAIMSRRYGYMFCHMRKSFMPRLEMTAIAKKTKVDIDSMVVDAMRKEQDRTRAELSLQVSNDVATNVPLQMTDNEQARNADFPLWLALMFKFKKSDAHVDPCIVDAFCKHDHKDQHDNEACPEGESIVKRQRTSENSNYTRDKSSSQAMEESNLSGSVIYGLELVPICLINGDVELYWVINLASSLKLFL
ncbi:hypothetical protein Tco_1075843 [Tanacetum coccineum]